MQEGYVISLFNLHLFYLHYLQSSFPTETQQDTISQYNQQDGDLVSNVKGLGL